MVARFLPLARKLARRYATAHEPLEDLTQVASIGLLKAIDRFEPDRGIAFSSYAVPTILGELKRYFRDLGWSVHVPRGAQEKALRVEQARQELASEGGRSPSVVELAQYLEWGIEEVLDAVEAGAAHHAVSLELPADGGDEESATLGQSLGEEDPRYAGVEASLSWRRAARQLPPRERRVLFLRFACELTQVQIADRVGVSQMQVSRILRRALRTLQQLTGDAPPRVR